MTLRLTGCTYQPLMNYLKALGIFRLISEQKDSTAKAYWENETLILDTSLCQSAILNFFLNEYKPTPLLGPWGARSGWYPDSSEKSARVARQIIYHNSNQRFQDFNDAIKEVEDLLNANGFSNKPKEEEKLRLMQLCRAQLSDRFINWIDTVFVLTADDYDFPPILGTGGNEGSLSYLSGFLQMLVECLIKRRHNRALRTSLFGDRQNGICTGQTPGHFSPFCVGGANQTQGLEGNSNTNPWDYIFCLEGTVLWASGIVRRYHAVKPSFPFTTTSISAVGHGGLAMQDSKKPKEAKRSIAEIWLPIWDKPCSLAEIKMLLYEGRATWNGRQAQNTIDFVRAVAGLGTDRGIKKFARNAFLMRNGQSFMAIPLGTIEVQFRPDSYLLKEVDRWLNAFRGKVSRYNTPPRFRSALWRIENAIFDFCRYGGERRFAEILCALGMAEKEIAVNPKAIGKDAEDIPSPIYGLSPQWLKACFDNSVEFELALSLSSMYELGTIRKNLEPVSQRQTKDGKKIYVWIEEDKAEGRSVVWNSSDLITNMINILIRRIMDGQKESSDTVPIKSRRQASLDAIQAFLLGNVDFKKLEELLWGFILIDHTQEYPEDIKHPKDRKDTKKICYLDRRYALLKMLFLARPYKKGGEEIKIKPESRILTLLSASRVKEACAIAMRRLRASGLIPMPHRRSSGIPRDHEWEGGNGRFLCAALLFDVYKQNRLAHLVLRPEEQDDSFISL